jgi:YaiO family outer membrane protein
VLCLPGGLCAQQSANDYERAVAARLAGEPAAAERLLRAWLVEHPGDADAQVQLGFALLALGRNEDARDAFAAALAIAPDYTDARSGLATANARLAGEARPAFIAMHAAISALPDPAEDWREAGIALSVPIARAGTLDTGATVYDRFGLTDTELLAGYVRRVGEDTWLRVGAGVTPDTDFRPELSFRAGLDQRVSRGPAATVLGLDAGWRRFPLQEVWNVSPAITQYLGGDGAFSITARADALQAEGDDWRLGGSLRADYAPAPQMRGFAGIAAGPDTDLGVVTDTRSVFGGVEVPVSPRLSASGSIAREWREDATGRTDLRVGLKLAL